MEKWLEEKYILLTGGHLDKFKKRNDNTYSFRCPVCGDSQKNKHKTRGYFYFDNSKFWYKCFNCETSSTFKGFLKKYYPTLFKQAEMEIFQNTYKKIKNKETIVKEKFVPTDKFEKECLIPAYTHQQSRKYLLDRKIPSKNIFYDIFWIDDIRNISKHFPDKYSNRFKYKQGRTLTKFKNLKSETIGYSMRSIDLNDKLRYITVSLNDEPMVYNLNKVDRNKTVYILEGQFDSMFINNSVAVGGSDLSRAMPYFIPDTSVLIPDNQPRNKNIVKQIQKTINSGYNVVIWNDKSLEHGKDINEMVQNGLTKEDIQCIIYSNTYRGLEANLQLGLWKKC